MLIANRSWSLRSVKTGMKFDGAKVPVASLRMNGGNKLEELCVIATNTLMHHQPYQNKTSLFRDELFFFFLFY